MLNFVYGNLRSGHACTSMNIKRWSNRDLGCIPHEDNYHLALIKHTYIPNATPMLTPPIKSVWVGIVYYSYYYYYTILI